MTGIDLRVGQITGDVAEALALRCTDELSLLDVHVDQVSALDDATGAFLVCAGDVAVRGLSVDTVEGARAAAAVVVAGHEVDWSGRAALGRARDDRRRGRRTRAGCARARVREARRPVGGAGQRGAAGIQCGARGRLADLARRRGRRAHRRHRPPCLAVRRRPGVRRVRRRHPRVRTRRRGRRLARGHGPGAGRGGAVRARTSQRHGAAGGCRPAGHRAARTARLDRGARGPRRGRAGAAGADDGAPGRVRSGVRSVLPDRRRLLGHRAWPTGRASSWAPETEVVAAPTVLATGGLPPFEPEPAPLPYDDPGPAGVPAELLAGDVVPDAPHDLRVDAELHARAERVPGDDDDAPVWVGALAPDTDARCELRDPAPPPADLVPAAAAPGPVVDYRARDARSLLALMSARAQQTMPGWTPTGAADQTQMLLELFAERLDRVAYRQEVALSEGALPTALERRSVEDHVRLVDYVPDPGLSATTMLRFRLDGAAATVPGIAEVLAELGPRGAGRRHARGEPGRDRPDRGLRHRGGPGGRACPGLPSAGRRDGPRAGCDDRDRGRRHGRAARRRPARPPARSVAGRRRRRPGGPRAARPRRARPRRPRDAGRGRHGHDARALGSAPSGSVPLRPGHVQGARQRRARPPRHPVDPRHRRGRRGHHRRAGAGGPARAVAREADGRRRRDRTA